MSARRKQITGLAVGLVWTALALAVAAAARVWARQPLDTLASLVVAAGLTGWVTGRLLDGAAARFDGLSIGGLAGHVAFVPPAIQLGQWFARLAVETAALSIGAASLLVSVLAFAAAASAVLSVGSALGLTLEAGLRLAFRRIGPDRSLFGLHLRRPSWRAIRITVLVAALLGALAYADRKIGLPWPEATPPVASKWIEREKALFRQALAGRRYDMVVLPVETDGPSFDRIGRSLMTRYLAKRMQERTGGTLPDPTLLARALDARARRIDLEDALRLAESVGARTVVSGKVRRAGQTFDFRAETWSRDDPNGRWRKSGVGALERLGHHDRLPASVAFRETVDALLDQLKIEKTHATAAQQPAAAPKLDASADDLLRITMVESTSAIGRARNLQLIAALHERESLEAETLWERSLVALWGAKDSSEEARILESRAYMHLSRRPYALIRLGEPASHAGRALLAALDGHVPDLETEAEKIEDRQLRLFAEIELADLHHAYGFDKRLIERRKTLPRNTDGALPALDFRLSAPEWFRTDVHRSVAASLSRLVRAELEWSETAAAWLHWLYWSNDLLGAYELRLARSIERRYQPAWLRRAADWPTRPAQDRLAEWDYYELLFAMNRRAMIKTLYSVLHRQALPEVALALIEDLGPLVEGHPQVSAFQARALDRIGEKAHAGAQRRLYSSSSALAVSAYRWEGGESGVSAALERYTYERRYEKYLDEPLRWYRATEIPPERLYFDRIHFSPAEMEREAASAQRRLEFADRNARPLRQWTRWLRRAGKMQEAIAAVESNRHRFVGTLDRAELLAEARATTRRGENPVPLYHELLNLDPDSWDARRRLAHAYMEGGDPQGAQKAFAAHPGFENREGQNVVALSNYAFEGGYYLYRRGEPVLGVPLLQDSAHLRTGSSAEFHARELLALMENDVNGAIRHARYQVERYNNGPAAMRQVLYVFLLGRRDEASSLLGAYADRFRDEDLWTAAFVSHRMQGLEGRELENWLAQHAARDSRRDYLTNALRERHAFMLAMIDRNPSSDSVASIRRVARANNNSPFYPDLAEGYLAFQRRDYAAAAKKLRAWHNELFNISVTRRQSLNEWLPYVALSYARSGQSSEADKLMTEHVANLGVDSDYLVARALLEGEAGRHDSAMAALRVAFHRLPATGTRALMPGYVLLEACEILFESNKGQAYDRLIEDFAHRLQVEVPYSWAAAFEAKYGQELDTRQLALAAAAMLDPKSERIRHFVQSGRDALRAAAIRHRSPLGAALRQQSRRP